MKRETLSAARINWKDWQFVLISSSKGAHFIDLQGRSLAKLTALLGKKVVPDSCHRSELVNQISEYLNRKRTEFSLPLDIQGTGFQLAVWNEVAKIRYATTNSYGEIASSIGCPRAARAVGSAVGKNPLPIIIPCHRVIGKDGSLVGFGGGMELKKHLLALETGE